MSAQDKGAVLVTGASTGIGKACAQLLAQSNYKVFAGVREIESGKRLQEQCSNNLSPVILDITNPDQIAAAFKAVKKALGPGRHLKALVNNAGIGVVGPVEFFPLSVLRRHFEVNVIGHIAVTQIFLSEIRKGKGRIVNMSSVSGRIALPLIGAYAASKFAMEALTDALRRELKPWGIPVSIVEPGRTETPILEKALAATEKILAELPAAGQELYGEMISSGRKFVERRGRRRVLSPESVARTVQKVLEARKPRTRYVVGADARIALIGRFLPDRFIDWVVSRILVGVLERKQSTSVESKATHP